MKRKKISSSASPSSGVPGEFQIGPGMMVLVAASVYDGDGQLLDGGESELEFVFGFGQLLPRLETALDGARIGDEREAMLRPEEAFGPRDPDAVIEVDRSEFPEDVAPGDAYEFENPEGEMLVMNVLQVDNDSVLLDANHPLAGQGVRYLLKVVGLRPATESEITEAEECALAGTEAPDGEDFGVIPAERLHRGRLSASVDAGPDRSGAVATTSDASADSGKEAER